MALPSSPEDAASSVFPLVEQFARLDAQSKHELLLWVRSAPPLYGAWKSLKKLFKLLDEKTRSEFSPLDDADVALLAALMRRIDDASPVARSWKWRSNEGALPRGGRDTYDVSRGDFTMQVGAHPANSWRGWSLFVAPRGQGSGTVWSYDHSDYSGGPSKATLSNGVVTVTSRYRDLKWQVDVSDPTFPHIVGDGPRAATWAYVKRRSRRLLRRLQDSQPDLYWRVLLAFLREAPSQNPAPVQWRLAWADSLFGHSAYFRDGRHGRGPLVRSGRFFWRRARLERSVGAWNGRLDDVRALWREEGTEPEVAGVAFNVLRSLREDTAALWAQLSPARLQSLLFGNVAFLRAGASRETLRRWEAGEVPSGASAARLRAESGARVRECSQVLVDAALQSQGLSWRRDFTKPLLALLEGAPVAASPDAILSRPARRALEAARLLATRLGDAISIEAFWKHLGLWARIADDEGNWAWIEERASAAGQAAQFARLSEIAQLQAEAQTRVARAFSRHAGEVAPTKEQVRVLVLLSGESAHLGWRFLAASRVGEKELRGVWKQLFEGYFDEAITRAALGADAATLFRRVRWQEGEIANWTKEDPRMWWRSPWTRTVPHASAPFFRALMEQLPAGERPRRVFRALTYLPLESQDEVESDFASAAAAYAPTAQDIRDAMISSPLYMQAKGHAASWCFLARTRVGEGELREVWKELFALPIMREAASAAIVLWRRAAPESSEVAAWLQAKPGIVASYAPNFLAALMRESPSLLLAVLPHASDEQTRALQVLAQEQLRDEDFRTGFWTDIWPRLRDETDRTVLERHLLGDEEIRRSFTLLSPDVVADLFGTDERTHELFLLSWLDIHLATLGQDDRALLLAATSPLSPVHERALDRWREVGLNLPVALRLLESLLPPAQVLARGFFEATPRGSDSERERALALCDSPATEVQAIGREFVLARRDTLLSGETLTRLGENTHPQMQAWVAQQLKEGASGADTREFDRAVLRSRSRSRRAKETVKERLGAPGEKALPVDALLEMARGRVPRDREWALKQLAILKLQGQVVPGVELREA
jgi:hypothetical protein